MTPDIAGIGIAAAFLAGMISFLSPCVLPLVPGYISFIAGSRSDQMPGRLATLSLSACFVLGFSTVFIILGASATVLGSLLLTYRYEANIVGGVLVILFGAFTAGFLKLPVLQRDLRYHGAIEGGRPLGAFLLGLAFGFGWTPCIGPILGAILTLAATADAAGSGVALLAIYSLGLGVPFLLSAVFADWLAGKFRRMGAFGAAVHKIAGIVMIAMGIAMISGHLSLFAFWLLQRFPILSQIG